MKTEFRKNEGDVVRSLLDGMFYRVLNISEESVTAKPVEEEDIDGKRVFIETPADTIDVNRNVFDELFFVVEKAPATVPGDGTFSISNGMFLKNGNRIETGTLVPVEIMALIPGAVLLTVRSRTEGKLDLFHYDVETDEFHKLTNAKDRIEFVYGYGSQGQDRVRLWLWLHHRVCGHDERKGGDPHRQRQHGRGRIGRPEHPLLQRQLLAVRHRRKCWRRVLSPCRRAGLLQQCG